MRVAWFSPLPPVRSGIAAYSAELLPRLRGAFVIDTYPEAAAHDFIWRNRLAPYDLVVYQLGNATCHDYVWAYLVRYPGLVVLHDARLHHARARQLLQQRRVDEYRREFEYDHPAATPDSAEYAVLGLGGVIQYLWPMLRSVIRSARLVAVHNEHVAATLRDEYGGATIETIRMGVPPLTASVTARADVRASLGIANDAIVFAVFGKVTAEKRIAAIVHAFHAVVGAGVNAYLLVAGDDDGYGTLGVDAEQHGIADRVRIVGYVADEHIADYLAAADVCLCLRWPTALETSAAWLRCLAAARPTVVTDLAHTADVAEDVALRVDLIDEEASLVAAMRALAGDEALRRRVAANGYDYWSTHHTMAQMAGDYERILMQAAAAPAPQPADLPAHLTADHSQVMRAILTQVGVSVDLGD